MAKFPYIIGKWAQGYIMHQQRMILNGLQYFSGLPNWVQNKASLSFNAEWAEYYNDYETNKLYFRDANFNRVAATFSRTSDATRVNKQGLIETVATGIPRIDYTDGSAKLLMEPSRTNLILDKSLVVGNPKWTVASRTSLAVDSEIGLDGTQTAAKYSVTADGNTEINYNVWNNPTGLAVGTYVFSFFVKDIVSTVNSISVYIDRASGIDTPGNWNTATNNVSANCFLEQYGEWYRFSTVFTQTAGNEQIQIDIRMPSATTGDGMTIWAPQLEAGSYPTSYIPTAGSSVTRNEDQYSVLGIADILNDAEGVLFVNQSYSDVSGNNDVFTINGGSNANRVSIQNTAPGFVSIVVVGSVASFSSAIVGTSINNQFTKLATAYKENDFAFLQDGTILASSSSGSTFPDGTLNRLESFISGYSGLRFHGKQSSIIYFNTRLSDEELIQLTS